MSNLVNAGKPWTLEDDRFIRAYYMVGIDMIAEIDLERTAEETEARYRFLKSTRAWHHLLSMQKAEISACWAKGHTMAYRQEWQSRFDKSVALYNKIVKNKP